ncbi:molybdopterin converting factor subunit 1 [Marinobacter koreensis]|uniref:Molybdopterin synthase sulfur carrier subunit n=1 Tax=Marinobacter koreensis TaxID=335974 RepID=A0ABW0RTA0_9GAMM|nr:molybdopterin converting factor subunit 1 [Marinobacter koreensis]MCK7548980.1 molybdopterin converting factor subunit 1 [Marinobacter koreensis]MDX1817415.1 molybdopterin converting factor subunit 1 [Marinobacter sp.]
MSNETLTVRFFARLREELDTEALELPAEPGLTAGDLLTQLAARGGAWSQLQGGQPVMIAVNQTMARPSTRVQAGDEVAFFPPVTGG